MSVSPFLLSVMSGNDALKFQQLLSSFTGDNRINLYFYGNGEESKSLLIKLLRDLFKDPYSTNSSDFIFAFKQVENISETKLKKGIVIRSQKFSPEKIESCTEYFHIMNRYGRDYESLKTELSKYIDRSKFFKTCWLKSLK
jgi:hypothetical protein